MSALYPLEVRENRKTLLMAKNSAEEFPMAVQLAGCEPDVMAEAAKLNEDRGAAIIDINFGCPVKKVVNGHAGSALMRDEVHAARILEATVKAVKLPVTLKMRTGWDATNRNAPSLARIAEECGIRMLTVHGRTREQGYSGQAEYDTIAAVKQAVNIPVVANGDIDSPEKAQRVLRYTGADAVMIGRAAQGRPWIFREISHYLATGEHLAQPLVMEVRRLLLDHLQDHYALYGEDMGVRSARKHIGWYVHQLPQGDIFRRHMNTLETAQAQHQAVAEFFDALSEQFERLPHPQVSCESIALAPL